MPTNNVSRIHLAAPHMGGGEAVFVQEAFESNWVSTVGPNLDAFERELGARLGRHCVALASGTAAIHLGLRWLGVGAGDEVWCPTFTFVASVNPVLYEGATPVFFDCDPVSWNIDADLLEESLRDASNRGTLPKAIIVVDLYGQTADMKRILPLAAEYGVPVLEDAAEALGSDHRGKAAGSFGQVSALSFNGNKIITTSGGGLFTAEDPAAADKVRHWATQARDSGTGYVHSERGYNYRLSNVLAGVGRGQLQVLDDRVRQKRALYEHYLHAFADVPLAPAPDAGWGLHTRWLSCFTVESVSQRASRDMLIASLAADNIEARPLWKPMHQQRLFKDCRVVRGRVADDLFMRGVCLPSGTGMDSADVSRVVTAVRRGLTEASPDVHARVG